MPDSGVQADFATGTARLHVQSHHYEDYSNILNALEDGPSVPAVARFDLRWNGTLRSGHLHDSTNLFDLSYHVTPATIAWSAHERGFDFVSDPADTSSAIFALIGQETNGAFFS